MEPILIFKDDSKIEEVLAIIAGQVSFYQAFYDEMQQLDIDVTLPQMSGLISYFRNIRGSEDRHKRINGFVQGLLLDKAGTPDFNGVPISQQMLRQMIEIPDLGDLYSLFDTNYGIGDSGNYTEKLQLVDGVVSKKATADDEVENEFSYYTRTDYGNELVGQLTPVITALNSYLGFAYPNLASLRYDTDGAKTGVGIGIQGLVYSDRQYAIDHKWLRQQEERFL